MVKRHAYLIMAHSQPLLLRKLLTFLDVEDNDIFLHLDKKYSFNISELEKSTKYANIYFTHRLYVNWGGVSQIHAEMLLIEKAKSIQKYDYYHLLTGSDLPIVPISEVNNFYQKHEGKLFLSFANPKLYKENYNIRIRYKHFFWDNVGKKKNFYYFFDKILYKIQSLLLRFIDDKAELEKFCFGSAYWDLDDEAVTFILKNKDVILKKYKYSFCCDEVFVHQLLWNEKNFRDRLYISNLNNGLCGNLRWMSFKGSIDGSPVIITKEHQQEIMNSNLLFARKFDEVLSKEVIEFLENSVHSNK